MNDDPLAVERLVFRRNRVDRRDHGRRKVDLEGIVAGTFEPDESADESHEENRGASKGNDGGGIFREHEHLSRGWSNRCSWLARSMAGAVILHNTYDERSLERSLGCRE